MSPDRELSPTFSQTLAESRRLWKFALGSPILYLMLGRLFVSMQWIDPSTKTARPHDNPMTQTIFLLAAAGIAVALAILTWRRTRLPREVLDDPAEALRRWTRNFYLRLSLCDSLAFLGLFYYLLSAHTWALLAGGASAYVAYLFVYPRQQDGQALEQ